jgi:anti-anti-sigma factor
MAGNFSISVHKTSDHIHVRLNGDFDGSSACELLNLLSNGPLSTASKIMVDTDSLRHIHPFGLRVLRKRLHEVKSRKAPLIFTGKNSKKIQKKIQD